MTPKENILNRAPWATLVVTEGDKFGRDVGMSFQPRSWGDKSENIFGEENLEEILGGFPVMLVGTKPGILR